MNSSYEHNSSVIKKNFGSEIRRKNTELIISNLDSSIDCKELYNILLSKLKQYVMVLNISINVQIDRPSIAIVKVATQQEAQLVIFHLHHQILGNKRITVSYSQPKSDADKLRLITKALLQEAPSNSMPLFKFFELAESRYHCSISLSEVNKFKDICKVAESQKGRTISLKSEAHTSLPLHVESELVKNRINHIPEDTIVVTQTDVGIPKRQQTPEEVKRTKEFALEIRQLLSQAPYCSMFFNKFFSAYQHHFGHQCRVSEYGFTNLVELFEAIAHTVDLEGSSFVDRKVKLKLPLALNVLGDQIQTLIEESNYRALYVDDVLNLFTHRYGYTLKPEAYECKDFMELIFKLSNFVGIIRGSAGTLLAVTDMDIRSLEIRVWSLLLNPPHTCSIRKFIFDYRVIFLGTLSITKLEQLKTVVVMIDNGTEMVLFLTPLYILAARLYHLLFVTGGTILLCDVANMYLQKFGIPLSPYDYGMNSFEDLFWQLSFAVTLKGSGNQLSIVLNKDLAEYGLELPSAVLQDCKNPEFFNWPSPVTNLSYKKLYSFSSLIRESSSFQGRGNLFFDDIDSSNHVSSNRLSTTTPPHPTDLPTPDKLMSQGLFLFNPSRIGHHFADDSGISNSRYDETSSNNELCFFKNQLTS